MATKKPSAAQIAARKKFSDIMKAGGFKKNPLTRVKKSSPSIATGKAPSTRLKKRRAKTAKAPAGYYANPAQKLDEYQQAAIDDFAKKYGRFWKEELTSAWASGADAREKDGYLLRQIRNQFGSAWLNKYKAPTRRKNPTILITDTPKKRTVIRRVNPAAKKRVKYTNIAKDMMGELNVGYSVHKQTNPSYMAIAWFTNKKDAISVAQEAADRTGVQMAVSRVQTHFMR
jgi:hypothetical protein